MTNVTIRISTSATGPNKPATGIMGAFGGTIRGDLTDTTVEVTAEDLDTMGDAVVAVKSILPALTSAFTQAVQGTPAVTELTGDADSGEPLVDAVVGVDEEAEKQRRKSQRKRARQIILDLGINGPEATIELDAKTAVRALEDEGIIR